MRPAAAHRASAGSNTGRRRPALGASHRFVPAESRWIVAHADRVPAPAAAPLERGRQVRSHTELFEGYGAPTSVDFATPSACTSLPAAQARRRRRATPALDGSRLFGYILRRSREPAPPDHPRRRRCRRGRRRAGPHHRARSRSAPSCSARSISSCASRARQLRQVAQTGSDVRAAPRHRSGTAAQLTPQQGGPLAYVQALRPDGVARTESALAVFFRHPDRCNRP